MREILFRGLTTNGEFVFGSLVNTTRGIKHMPNQQSKTWIITSAFGSGGWFNVQGRSYVRSETVGQFTGMHDCNGVRIFEGDIVEDEEHYISKIYWDSNDFMFCATDVGGLIDMCSQIKIIGNIHQNPELLERTNANHN